MANNRSGVRVRVSALPLPEDRENWPGRLGGAAVRESVPRGRRGSGLRCATPSLALGSAAARGGAAGCRDSAVKVRRDPEVPGAPRASPPSAPAVRGTELGSARGTARRGTSSSLCPPGFSAPRYRALRAPHLCTLQVPLALPEGWVLLGPQSELSFPGLLCHPSKIFSSFSLSLP